MATVQRNFVVKTGLTAEGGDLTIKAGNSLILNDSSENSISITAPTLSGDYDLVLPTSDGDANELLQTDGSGNLSWVAIGDLGGGTVTSVGVSVPTGLTVSNSPVTTSGTIAIAFDTGYEIPLTTTLNSFATLTGTETLTNKTLTSPTLNTPTITGNTTFSDGAFDFDIASHDGTNGLSLAGTVVTSSAAELNLLDGSSAGTVVNGKAVIYGASGELAVDAGDLTIGGVAVTSTAAELNILDGATLDVNELNILDGILASTSELNTLDGITSSTSELNVLDGYLGSVTELNYLKDLYDTGVTATEYDYLDGVTSNIQTQLNAKLADTVARVTDVTFNSSTGVLTIDDKDGTGTDIDLTAFAGIGTTSLSLAANTLTYTDANGDETDIDLSIYLDDTNLARLTSGSVNADGVATFTRDDNSTFSIDFSPVFGGYSLSVGADDSTLRTLGPGESIKFSGAQNVTTASDAEGNITITGPDLSSYATLTGTETLTNKTLTSAEINTQLSFPDDVEIRLGTGGDVKIDYDGTDYITNISAGDEVHQLGADFELQNNAGTTTLFKVDQDGETSLRHNGSEKLNTASTGIEVTGEVKQDTTTLKSNSAGTGTTSTIAFTGSAAEITIAVEDITDSTKRQISKILVTHDGTDVYINEYGATWSDSELISGITGTENSGTVTVTVTTTASSKHRLYAVAFA